MSYQPCEAPAAYPTKDEPEVLTCPCCKSAVTHWFTRPEWRGKTQVRYEHVSHQVPGCELLEVLKKKHIDVYLKTARAAAER
jgi:hypothetical protein